MASRLEHVRSLIHREGFSGILIVAPTDLYYITGISLSRGIVLITSQKAWLFIDPRYSALAQTVSSDFDVRCHLQPSLILEDLKTELQGIDGKIGFDAATMTVEKFQEISSLASPSQLIPSPSIFSHLRRPKTTDEISLIEESCRQCESGFLALLSQIQEGVTEQYLSHFLKTFWFENGADGVSFEPIIAFGAHSACPHWTSSDTVLKANSPILIDIGVKCRGYHSDMTRTLFFGRPDHELLLCHELVQEAYTLAFLHARAGVLPHALDKLARDFLEKKGYGQAFIHGLGHGVGLEVHEPPRVSAFAPDETPLEVGDVFTIEPGIYLPERGGIRIENTIVIGLEGARSLFSVPITPIFL